MSDLIFLATNLQEAETLVPVARAIRARGDCKVQFCILDDFFGQNVAEYLGAAGEVSFCFPIKRQVPRPFYLLSALGKARVVLENAGRIRALARRYAGVVCGSDGALERVFIKSIQSAEGKAYLVNYGLLFDEFIPHLTNLVRKAMAYLGLSHLFYS